ncbi:protein of unknown function (plasmid) [Azospirillum baldaniorum]|uniref:Uncharacterized protein n=1 Tax=Azospirillum baldaniorum TaxID=1064539 RepID=A0A9P1NP01_9PROT|nr:protein of unknown function [Azospirillum baldaniorum]
MICTYPSRLLWRLGSQSLGMRTAEPHMGGLIQQS